MEEDVLILLGVAFNLNLPLLTAWAARLLAGRPVMATPSRLWLSARPSLSVSTG